MGTIGHGVFWLGCFDGSRVSFFACIGRFTKNHQSFITFLYDNICCTYFDDISFVALLVAVSISPPAGLVGLCGRVVRQSCWTCAWWPDWVALNRSLYWRCQPIEYRCLGCPPSGILWHPNGYGGMLHIWFGAYSGGMYVYWYDTGTYEGGGVHADMLCLNCTVWPSVFSDWWGGPIGLNCCRSWVGERGRFVGWSLRPTFIFTYLDNN
jgi:hypothetical protein